MNKTETRLAILLGILFLILVLFAVVMVVIKTQVVAIEPSLTPTLAMRSTATKTPTMAPTSSPTATSTRVVEPTLVPTWTPAVPPTPVATEAPTTIPDPPAAEQKPPDPVSISTNKVGAWDLAYYQGATEQMKGWQFGDLVKDWSQFPNVDYPPESFLAKDGVEYGMAESAYCQQSQTCDVNVPAMHYRLVTGDYSIPGIDECSLGEGGGCGIMLVNVGTVTAMFRDSRVDYGFTVEGRYWNGDAMPTTIRALLSHTAYNMLNEGGNFFGINLPVNPGANCSSAFGCDRVRLVFAILSGNELLVKGRTVIQR